MIKEKEFENYAEMVDYCAREFETAETILDYMERAKEGWCIVRKDDEYYALDYCGYTLTPVELIADFSWSPINAEPDDADLVGFVPCDWSGEAEPAFAPDDILYVHYLYFKNKEEE